MPDLPEAGNIPASGEIFLHSPIPAAAFVPPKIQTTPNPIEISSTPSALVAGKIVGRIASNGST